MSAKTKKDNQDEQIEKNIEREETNERLKCYLTDGEKLECADVLAKKMNEREIKQDEFDSIKKQFSGEISTLDNEIKNAQRLYYDGYEFRLIACQVERDYNTKTYTLTRVDTGEVVETRPLRPSEMQRKLLLDEQARMREQEAAANA